MSGVPFSMASLATALSLLVPVHLLCVVGPVAIVDLLCGGEHVARDIVDLICGG